MNAWDRFPDEPSSWFERFDRFFRPLGPDRTVAEAYRLYYNDKHGIDPERPGASPDWLQKAKHWNWRERADKWDEELRAERLTQERETHREMADRHIREARAVQALAMQKIIEDGIPNADTALRAWRQAVQIEKTASGIPDYIADVSDMDDEELTRELAKELARAGVHEADFDALKSIEDDRDISNNEQDKSEEVHRKYDSSETEEEGTLRDGARYED